MSLREPCHAGLKLGEPFRQERIDLIIRRDQEPRHFPGDLVSFSRVALLGRVVTSLRRGGYPSQEAFPDADEDIFHHKEKL